MNATTPQTEPLNCFARVNHQGREQSHFLPLVTNNIGQALLLLPLNRFPALKALSDDPTREMDREYYPYEVSADELFTPTHGEWDREHTVVVDVDGLVDALSVPAGV